MLQACGFTDVKVETKEESREYIKDWLPGSCCEEFVVSAYITATKPGQCTASSAVTSNFTNDCAANDCAADADG